MPTPDDTSASATSVGAPQQTVVTPTGLFAKPWVRVVASLVVVYHFLAVLVEPLSIPPRFAGERPMVPAAVRPAFQPYMTALSLEQGYRFFAPDPGNSHLIRYDLYFADGRAPQIDDPENEFPNRRKDWPRLLYHRYFMLAEHLPKDRGFADWDRPSPTAESAPPSASIIPPGAEFVQPVAEEMIARDGRSPDGEPREEDPRQAFERLQNAYITGFAKYLAEHHGAERVDLYHVVHRLSHPDEIIAGRKLDEPDTYRKRLLISYKFIVPKKAPAGKSTNEPTREGAR